MDNQQKFKAQQTNYLFADDRAERPRVPDTVARGDLDHSDYFNTGVQGNQWGTTIPLDLSGSNGQRYMARGRQRFEIYCSPCHGYAGYGDGMVAKQAAMLAAAGTEGMSWVAPASLQDRTVVRGPSATSSIR